MAEAMWYVVHTYSGYENKVKMDIEKTIENRKLHDQILEVSVPMQDVVELKNGVRKTVAKKMFPGYVLINMEMNDETWYVVRNIRGCTGFVGPASKPVPLTDAEVAALGVEKHSVELQYKVGDLVKVTYGPFENLEGTVEEIDIPAGSVRILRTIFGRQTPVEMELDQISLVD